MFETNFDFSELKRAKIIESVIPLHNFYELDENPIEPWVDNDMLVLGADRPVNESLIVKE